MTAAASGSTNSGATAAGTAASGATARFWAVAGFQFRSRLRRPSTVVYAALLFALGFVFMHVSAGAFSKVSVSFGGKVLANAPLPVFISTTVLAQFAVLLYAAVVGDAVHQDTLHDTWGLLFTTPLRRSEYFFGRFVGAIAYLAMVSTFIGVGLYCGSRMPYLDPARIGPATVATYAWPLAATVAPTLLFSSAVFLSVAVVTRRILAVYMTGALLLIGYLMALSSITDLERAKTAALFDPFGLVSLSVLTQYWSVAEQNTRSVPLEGTFLHNRLLWTAVGAAVLFAAYRRFSSAPLTGRTSSERVVSSRSHRAPRRDNTPSPRATTSLVPAPLGAFHSAPPPSGLAWAATTLHIARFHAARLFGNVYVLAVLFAALLFQLFMSRQMGALYGTPTLPVSRAVIEISAGTFFLFALALTTFVAGELVHDEREADLHDVVDATSVPTWALAAGKAGALVLFQWALVGVLFVAGLLIQLTQGFLVIEWSVYGKMLFGVVFGSYLATGALALFVHALVRNKYAGHALMLAYYLFGLFAKRLGFEHGLFRFGQWPSLQYSDMNGYAPFRSVLGAYGSYFACASALLVVGAIATWQRGRPAGLAAWARELRRRLRGRFALVIAAAGVLTLVCAAFIVVNTCVWNDYETEFDRSARTADFERTYASYAGMATVTVVHVDLDAQLYPAKSQAVLRAKYVLKNETSAPVDTLFVSLPAHLRTEGLSLSVPATASVSDDRHHVRVFRLAEAVRPGDTVELSCALHFERRGFRDHAQRVDVTDNGSFLLSLELLRLAYPEDRELHDPDARKKHGLPPKTRMRDPTDAVGLAQNILTADAHGMTVTTTVTTDADQVAIAPGDLEASSVDGSRARFRYHLRTPALHLFGLQSGRYRVLRERWNDVAIEIYYHHDFNVDRMMASAKATLAYCTEAFGPYPHKFFRIVEFPRYEDFAMALPGTIPFSENIGFVLRRDTVEGRDIDFPFYVTSHEVAHQWWAHQLVGANVQGAAMTSESFAQYTALRVMHKELGRAQMGRFLRYEMNKYLIGRSTERAEERPLASVEQQPYIYYQKGGITLYALAELAGESVVNGALRTALDRLGHHSPPYPTAADVVAVFREVFPAEHQEALTDAFHKRILYENRTTRAVRKKQPDGRWLVRVTGELRKMEADALGAETTVPMNDVLEFAVLDGSGGVLASERLRKEAGPFTWEVTVAEEPAKAGVDPFGTLIDRTPDDNTARAEDET